MRVAQVSLVRPAAQFEPADLIEAWPTLTDIASAVAKAGAEVTVVQSFHRDAELTQDGVRYRFVREPVLPGRFTGLSPGAIKEAVQRIDPDVIHVNGLDFWRHTRPLCSLGAPVLAQDHASSPGRRSARRRWGLAKVAAVAFTHPDQARPFFADGSLRPGTEVFGVPESSTRFTAGPKGAARTATGLRGDPALLWVGRLDRNKDPLAILSAVERAAETLPGLQLWCCFHEQPLLDEVRERVARSPRLRERVHLLGEVSREQVQALCRAADIFVSASHRESTGFALLEAIASGAIPIVTDIPPFRALTGEGAIGALVSPGDVEGFAKAIVEIARQRREGLRCATIEHFQRSLTFECVGRRLIGIYTALASGSL